MKLIDRVCNTLFKGNIRGHVDYHAGGFFVKKEVLYLLFLEKGEAILYNREEGGITIDNNSEILLNEIKKEGIAFNVIQPNETVNILKLFNGQQIILCMPSIFIENVQQQKLTEIILDDKQTSTNEILNFYIGNIQ
jgi:hypothetical protein